MADVKFTVEGKGKNLKKTADEAGNIGKSVDKSNAALDKAGGKQDAYNRREKGIYQTNLSSGKAYSKLAQNIGGGGSSSLVGAYATLAANVFALTAAFNALRSAAQFEQLVQGLNAVGDAAGRNLGHLGDRLKEITEGAISTERAMRAVAIGTSAGFSSVQLEKLTLVAKGASIALGRDMGDAMDRLVRGAAKLEPEILDELGIMVRLDEATENYASTIGKTASALTQFERRQAFINAINQQGLEKFEEIAASVDPVAYDQLAASLDKLAKSFMSLVNYGLGPFIDLLADSQVALAGVSALFVSTISRGMLPALHNAAGSAREAATQFAAMNPVVTDNIVTTGKLPAAYKKIGKAMKEGTASVEQMAEGQRVLNNSQKWYQNMVDKGESHPDYAKNVAGLENVTKAVKEHDRVLKGNLGTLSKVQAADAMTMTNFTSLGDGWGKLNESIKNNNLHIDEQVALTGQAITWQDKASKSAFKYGQRLKFIGAAAVNALPWIGMLVTVVGVLKQAWDHFNPGNKMKKAADEAMKAFDRLDEINEKLLRNTAKTNDELKKMKFHYEALGGVLNTVVDVVGEMGQAVFKQQNEDLSTYVSNLIDAKKELEEVLKTPEKKRRALEGGTDNIAQSKKDMVGHRQKELDEFRKGYGRIGDEGIAIMEKGLANATVQAELFIQRTGGMGQAIVANLRAVTFAANESIAEKQVELQSKLNPINAYNDSVKNASLLTAEFIKIRNKLFQKETTPFDDIEENLNSMARAFETTGEMAELSKILHKSGENDYYGPDYYESLESAQKRLDKLLIEEMGLRDALGIKTKEQFLAYKKEFEDRNIKLRKFKGTMDALKTVEKAAGKAAKSSYVSQAQAVKVLQGATEDRRLAEIEVLTAQKDNTEALWNHIPARRAILLTELAEAKTQDEKKEIGKKIIALAEEEEQFKQQSAEATSQITALERDKLHTLVAQAEINQAELKDKERMLKLDEDSFKLAKKTTDLEINRAKNAMQLANLRDPARRRRGTTELDPVQEYKLTMQSTNLKSKMIVKEYNLAIRRIQLDHDLLESKLLLEAAQSQAAFERYQLDNEGKDAQIEKQRVINDLVQSSTLDYIDGMEDILSERLKVALLEKNVSLETLQLEKEKAQLKSQKFSMKGAFEEGAGSEAMGGGGTLGATGDFVAGMRRLNEAKKAEIKAVGDVARKEAEENYRKDQAKGIASGLITEANVKAEGDRAEKLAIDAMPKEGLTESILFMTQATQGLVDGLKQLGPEGEVAAAVAEGAAQMTLSFSVAIDTFSENTGKLERGAAIASAVASTIAATANIMAKASAARISAIDKEIAAEQKRDGHSKKSQAKIKALQAQKDAMGRKAFNQNKKMMMAQTIASTAAGMMSVWPDPTAPFFPMKIALAAMIGAMGAAQLAIIAGTSYQSTGGGGGSSVPAIGNINMGERSNKVDIAGGRGNSGGELAYLRGARGSGTSAADFRPAFTGRKYRAAGGAAYVVGEQGPELFVPSVPGQVVSNDDMETGAAAGTVNFTINAIDAAGVEEVLVEQRGNIIGMIRESANEYGTDFLEDVNEAAYTSTTEGSVYGRA